jgi:hypothetical protein
LALFLTLRTSLHLCHLPLPLLHLPSIAQELLLLHLQAGVLRWEARQAGQAGKISVFDRFLTGLASAVESEPKLKLEAAQSKNGNSLWAKTKDLASSPNKVQQLLGLLAEQQPSIFRAASGQGQRAAVLDPLLACLHLQCVVEASKNPVNGRFAMHRAAEAGAVTQLRVLELLGADLDLPSLDPGMNFTMTPLMAACCVLPGQPGYGTVCWEQQQQQLKTESGMPARQQCREVLMEQEEYNSLAGRRLEVVQRLLSAGASFAHVASNKEYKSSMLALAAFAGLHRVVEYLLPLAKIAAGDESKLTPCNRLLAAPIEQACLAGNVRCLRLLLAAADGPRAKEALSRLIYTASACEVDAVKLLLEEGVPVNGCLQHKTPLLSFVTGTGKKPQVRCMQVDAHMLADEAHMSSGDIFLMTQRGLSTTPQQATSISDGAGNSPRMVLQPQFIRCRP